MIIAPANIRRAFSLPDARRTARPQRRAPEAPHDPKETQSAIYDAKDFIEEGLCRELNLMQVQVPLIVDVESGVNDILLRKAYLGEVSVTVWPKILKDKRAEKKIHALE